MSKIQIVAEIGVNWEGDIERAKDMICAAQKCGADVAKFQLYSVDTLFPDKKIISQNRNWYEEVKKTQLTKEQVTTLVRYCKVAEIEILFSVFDLERLAWLEELGVKRYKIASRSINDVELIQAIWQTGKETLISIPYGEFSRINPILQPLILGNRQFKFLYCIPEYPSPLDRLQLGQISWRTFTGFSDHSVGIDASIMAMARGCKIIEKHFCLSRKPISPDIVCSITPEQLRRLVRYARLFEEMM